MGNVISHFSVLLVILSNFISFMLWASFKGRERVGELVCELLRSKEPESKSVCVAFGKKSASFGGELLNSISEPISKENKEKPRTVSLFSSWYILRKQTQTELLTRVGIF